MNKMFRSPEGYIFYVLILGYQSKLLYFSMENNSMHGECLLKLFSWDKRKR